MRQLQIQAAEEGQRLDKYLSRYMPEAPKSFFYKMLRKKNITCNKKKCDGSEKLCAGDSIELFLAEDTIEKFRGNAGSMTGVSGVSAFANESANKNTKNTNANKSTAKNANRNRNTIAGTQMPNVILPQKSIIYEDKDILLINKAAGELSQKAAPSDVSLVEKVIGYALAAQKVSSEQLAVCRPSVCNRLDRNTSGLIAAGLSIRGLQFLSEQFRTRDLHKYYMALVKGCVSTRQELRGYLYKDEKNNIVEIHETLEEFPERLRKDVLAIETVYEPVAATRQATLLKVLLVTGRSHQIRAHLASIHHPIIGDSKYGDGSINERFRKGAGTKRQLLHAYEMVFPTCEGTFAYLSEKSFRAPLPNDFLKAMEYVGIWEWKE